MRGVVVDTMEHADFGEASVLSRWEKMNLGYELIPFCLEFELFCTPVESEALTRGMEQYRIDRHVSVSVLDSHDGGENA